MKDEKHLLIEAYLSDNLSLEEQQAFQETLVGDPELQKELNLYAAINHHLKLSNWKAIDFSNESEAKKQLNSYFKSREAKELNLRLKKVQRQYNATKSKPIKLYKYIAAVAAILLLITGFYFGLNQKSYKDLYVEYYHEKDLPSLVSRGNSSDLLTKGAIAYTQKDYNKSLNLFKKYIAEVDTLDPLVYSYQGMAHLQLQEYHAALVAFDGLLQSDSIDRSKGLWYKCLVYIKLKNKDLLKETLQKILKDPANFNYKKARELLDEL